jgi:TIGR03009 family protein
MPATSMNDVVRNLRRAVLQGEDAQSSDGQLLERFISRKDATAFAAIVERHGPMVWGVCRRMLANYHEAEDAFQATFLILVRRAAAIVPRSMLGNWLYGVAQQTARKARAMSARRQVHERQVTPMLEAAAAPAANCDLQEALDCALAALPDVYRVTIVVCDLEGKTRREAAQQLGWPEGTVASRLARARALLAARLARHGVAVAGTAISALLAQQSAAAAPPLHAATVLVSNAAAILVSPRAVLLAEGVIHAMSLYNFKTVAGTMIVLAFVGLMGAGPGLMSGQSARGQAEIHQVGQRPADDGADDPARPAGGKLPPVHDAPPIVAEAAFPTPQRPPPDADPEQMLAFVVARCSQAMAKLERSSAAVRRTHLNNTFGKTEVYEGTLKYLRQDTGQPALALLEMADSKDRTSIEKLLFTGTQVYNFDFGRKIVRIHDLPPLWVGDTNLMELLIGMPVADVSRRYQLRLVRAPKEEPQQYHYILVAPKTPADKRDFTTARLVVSAADFLPRQLWYRQPDGDQITWDFTMKANDATVTAQTFAAPPLPAGWRVERTTAPVAAPAEKEDRYGPATSKPAAVPGQTASAARDHIEPGDRLYIEVPDALPDQSIKGIFPGGAERRRAVWLRVWPRRCERPDAGTGGKACSRSPRDRLEGAACARDVVRPRRTRRRCVARKARPAARARSPRATRRPRQVFEAAS